jgi:cytoskeleton protein RodZ
MTKDTFGESLKREREMRGVTLDEISGATRIATRFLKAIETEQWDQLPGGVFNRGFVRAVARYLGLDEENIVAEYTLAVGDRPTVPVWTGSPPAVTPEQPWLAWIIAAVIILAIVPGGWFGTKRILARRAAKRAAQTAALSAEASSAEPAPGTTTSAAADSAPGSAATSAAAVPDATTVATTAAATTPAAPGTPAAVDPSSAAASSTSSPASPPSDLFELKIFTGKRTKVVVVADKDVVYDGTMKSGENHFFSAADHFQITAKDAGVVHMELNGKALAPIGPTGHSGKITLTRDALKGASGGAN